MWVSRVILYICLWNANERMATETMMGKAMTVTDSKTLWGEDPDKRNPCSSFICLNYYHFRVQSYLHSQFFHIFVWTIKATPGGGAHNHETCRFSGYHFSAEILEPGMKQNVSPCSFVELILFELLSKVEGTQKGHHKLAIPAYSRE